MENTKTPMKDKETKEFGKEWQDEQREKMVRIQFPKTIQRIEQEAERRGEKRYGISLSEKADKPYIVIDDMKQGGKTVFAGTLEHIQINKLLEEENG